MTKLLPKNKPSTAKPQAISDAKYLVSFISVLGAETQGYDQAATQMLKAVRRMPGFVAVYSARAPEGVGITLSYWKDLAAIEQWKNDKAHQVIQQKGKDHWYQWFQLQVCKIID